MKGKHSFDVGGQNEKCTAVGKRKEGGKASSRDSESKKRERRKNTAREGERTELNGGGKTKAKEYAVGDDCKRNET